MSSLREPRLAADELLRLEPLLGRLRRERLPEAVTLARREPLRELERPAELRRDEAPELFLAAAFLERPEVEDVRREVEVERLPVPGC